jgi:hypothetical protein
LQVLAPGLTPKAVLEKLATIQMLDVWFPTADGRWLVMPRFTQPEADQAILLHKLKLELPQQPPPRIKARVPDFPPKSPLPVVPTFSIRSLKINELNCPLCPYCERQVRQLGPPIAAVLFLIAAGALANYFPRTTSDQPGFNRSLPCLSSSL